MVRKDLPRGVAGFSEDLLTREPVQAAVMALLHGVDPLAILDCHDPVKAAVLGAVVEEATRLHGQVRQDLANRVGNRLAQALSG